MAKTSTSPRDWLTGLLDQPSARLTEGYLELLRPRQSTDLLALVQAPPIPTCSNTSVLLAAASPQAANQGHWIPDVMIPGAQGGGEASAKSAPGKGGDTSGGGTTIYQPYTAGGAFTNYNIELTFLGSGWTQAFYSQATDMAELICRFITEDIADTTLQYRKQGTIIYDAIDDIEINLTLTNIDGAGGILGQAGPEYWRSGPDDYHLISEGSVKLDTADALDFLNQNLFDDILFHEMLHVIGIGTLWSDKQVANGYVYTGSEGTQAYEMSGFQGDLLIEDGGGSGTAGGHWEEGDNRTAMATGFFKPGCEIMTGYINSQNWLSWVTIASLEDLGYGTIWDSSWSGSINPVALSAIAPEAVQSFPSAPTWV